MVAKSGAEQVLCIYMVLHLVSEKIQHEMQFNSSAYNKVETVTSRGYVQSESYALTSPQTRKGTIMRLIPVSELKSL